MPHFITTKYPSLQFDMAADNFLETLCLIGSVYKPPDELLSQPAAAVAQPQAVANDSTGTTSVATCVTIWL